MRLLFLALIVSLLLPVVSRAGELTGYGAVEGRGFFDPQEFTGSLALAPEYYHRWESGASFTAVPFARLDSTDPERTHLDIRELFFLKVFDSFEASIGVRKVFWGVTESQHLVDIINQTDQVEGPDGEDKLGQPMVSLSIPSDYGTLDIYLMPYFRQRTFPGRKGRLRTEPYVDTDRATYESSAEEFHTDLALRYSHFVGDWDFALSHFYGTGREPTLIFDDDMLVPYYEIINQTGLEVQRIFGEWLLKLEAIYRSGQGEAYFATTTGFEYTFVSIGSSYMDLGLIGEWIYDDRGTKAPTPFENDIFFGARLTMNDLSDSSLLAGIIQDTNEDTRYFFIESSRRFGDRLRATLEARFQDKDDHITLELAYYL